MQVDTGTVYIPGPPGPPGPPGTEGPQTTRNCRATRSAGAPGRATPTRPSGATGSGGASGTGPVPWVDDHDCNGKSSAGRTNVCRYVQHDSFGAARRRRDRGCVSEELTGARCSLSESESAYRRFVFAAAIVWIARGGLGMLALAGRAPVIASVPGEIAVESEGQPDEQLLVLVRCTQRVSGTCCRICAGGGAMKGAGAKAWNATLKSELTHDQPRHRDVRPLLFLCKGDRSDGGGSLQRDGRDPRGQVAGVDLSRRLLQGAPAESARSA